MATAVSRTRLLIESACSIFLAQLAGLLGSLVTFSAIPTWYAALEKPLFNPPNWVFGPVWTLLYTLMGIAAVLVWQHRQSPGVRRALWLYVLHLVVNTSWSLIFFGAQNLAVAFFVILVLLAMIVALILQFSRWSKVSAWLLVPYLCWVTFATVLNGSLWMLNA